MISELGRVSGGGDEFENEIGMLLREQRKQDATAADDRERELNLYRSGSAPPTVEGSQSAVGGLFGSVLGMSEEELRSDPDYLSYYYSHVNLNPRLPPPLLSKEDWRFSQRFQGGSSAVGGIGDRWKVNKTEASFASEKEEWELKNALSLEKSLSAADWSQDGLIGLPGIGLGSKQKSFAEIFQDGLSPSNPNSRHPSRPVSRNAFDENADPLTNMEAELANLRRDDANIQGSSKLHNVGVPSSYSYATALGASLSRSTTPDPQHVPRVPSPCLTPIGGGRTAASERRTIASHNSFNGVASGINESADLVTSLAGMNLSTNAGDGEHYLPSQVDQDTGDQHNYHFNRQTSNSSIDHPYGNKSELGHRHRTAMPQSTGWSNAGGSELRNFQVERAKASLNSGNPFSNGPYASTPNGGFPPRYGPSDRTTLSFSDSGSGLSPVMASQLSNMNLPPLLENFAASSMGIGYDSMGLGGGLPLGQSPTTAPESHSLSRINNQITGNTLQGGFFDPAHLQRLRNAAQRAASSMGVEYAVPLAGFGDHSPDRSYSYMDPIQKAYIGSLMSPQISQYGAALGNKYSGSNHGYYGNHAFMGYHGSPLASPVHPNSPGGHGSPIRHNDFNMRYPAAARNMGGSAMGPWAVDGSFASSLLEEFKGNKMKSFELAEIAGHVVEFSSDQYGSRFIQQKLETASIAETNMVFEEIIPQALSLMTDVFGNYVIQKFFEHGMPTQRRELASKLDGHVLTLGLQMYGCRVIQKAIEVVDLDQKIKMVNELDGHIMRCVRDQNGNHVIQKCIECVPEESFQFIIESFFGHVITLSTHPYGCRVIQRVLEHCKDPDTQSKVMDEVLGSVSMLAQDQYGNYVIQHVLEHGKPHERSIIITELAGKIVQMSQQKFASNVVEKCLTFGGPDERELLVNEMLGTTDENEPLQVMMKDQFANYVVQKVLETCSDEQRELIMSRIKVHLNALKKYTYGKHIVARVEKLLVAGERRAGMSQNPAAAQMAE